MDSPVGFVELERRFSALDGSMPAEESAQQSYLLAAMQAREVFDWSAVLAHPLIVVLGEPGSGKSWEFLNRAATLRRQGQETFYVELEQLVSRPLEAILGPDDQRRFQKWLNGHRTARFFLDSVDEAKLRRASDFHTSLQAIRNAVGAAALNRASFVVSSRISEWQPATDRSEILARLAPSRVRKADSDHEPSGKAGAPILILQILPLSREQVRKFVAAKGIADVGRFIGAIDEHHAWEFARRPIDVISLVEFWLAYHRLGTLTEMIEYDLMLKLRETTPRQKNFPLSEADARSGAETLAAATLLCQALQFKVPDDSFLGSGALDATRCLPSDWKSDQCAALLSRPLFDSATYGTIRFHHRRIAEYLAAAWLRSRMAEGCPTPVLLQLLFNENGGQRTARRGLIPVTAWLCAGNAAWNHEVRSWVLTSAPEMHLEYGDAEALSVEYRRATLSAIVARNDGRVRVWLESAPDALQRLATQDLATDISELLRTSGVSADVRAQLVMLVRFGELRGCLPALLDMLSSAGPDDDIQVSVLAALRDMGTEDSLRHAWDILRARDVLSDDICAIACEALYPRVIGPRDIAALFMKTQRKPHASTHLPWVVKRHLHECLSPSQSGELLVQLNQLAQTSPHISFQGKETRISDQFLWVLDVIPAVLLRLLKNEVLTDAESSEAALAIALLGESRYFPDLHSDEDIHEIDTATIRHPKVRSEFFWHAVVRWRSEGMSGRPLPWVFFNFSGVLSAKPSDIEWLVDEVADSSDSEDRKLCLDIVLMLGAARTRRGRRRLREATGGSNDLSQLVDRAVSGLRWMWARRIWFYLTEAALWKDRWLTLEIRWLRLRDAYTSWRVLLRSLRSMRSGESLELLAGLSREAAGDRMRWGTTNWAALSKKRGRLVASAVKQGCKRCFQSHTPPPLPHEKSDPRTVSNSVIVGLIGFQALLDDEEISFRSISDEVVRSATRYAVNELNGFPVWLGELAKIRPAPVSEVLNDCVRGEWNYQPAQMQPFDVLHDLATEGGELARLVRKTVIELFQNGNPPNLQIFEFALEVLIKTAVLPDPAVAVLATQRCRAEASADADAFALWAVVCLQFEADQGILILEDRLCQFERAPEVVLNICNILSGEFRSRLTILAQPDYLRPTALRNLIPFVFRYVRPEDDIDRRGIGPYTPTTRDQASRFRDRLLVILSQSEAPNAAQVLQELRDVPELASQRDWLLHLIDQRASKDADLDSWSPADLRAFSLACKTAPDDAPSRRSPTPRPDVVVVTVNEHETRAVMDAFKVATGREGTAVSLGGRVYHDLGTLNGTSVFHVISEMGSGGVGAMQQTVDKAIRGLKPNAIVAVGIAFGIDEEKQAIGDILVSKQLRLYELQRVGKDKIVLRGAAPDASPRLISHFKTFAQTKWNGAPISFGLILTGEKLVDNLDYRTQLLALESEAVGGEMEGAGLYVSGTDHKVDWIVLKAICDFADGNKGKNKRDRQILAARNAAQFLVEALQYAPLTQTE